MSRRRSGVDLTGIEVRHRRGCPALDGGACRCAPGYRATVRSKRDRRKIQRTFATAAAAALWRQDALVDIRRGKLRAPKPITVRDVAQVWLADAEAGLVHDRSGKPYKPSSLRGYEQALRTHIVPALGGMRLGEVFSGVRRQRTRASTTPLDPPKRLGTATFLQSGAAQESNLPTAGLRRLTGFEDRLGHQPRAAPR